MFGAKYIVAKLIIIMLNPVITCCVLLSFFVLIEDVKKRKRAAQHAHFVLNMKAYIPTRTDPSWYISARPPSASDF
jgi:hypothetical protein